MPKGIANVLPRDVGDKCPHGSTYGTCPSSMCHVWSVYEMYQCEAHNMFEAAEKALGSQVYYNDVPVETDPHHLYDRYKTFLVSHGDCTAAIIEQANNGKLSRLYYWLEAHAKDYGFEVRGSYISQVIIGRIGDDPAIH